MMLKKFFFLDFYVIFINSYIISLIVILLLPAKSVISNIQELLILNITHISFVLIGSFIFRKKRSDIQKKRMIITPNTKRQLKINSRLVSFVSLLGFLFMLYDRIFIRRIDYSLGIRNARYQWMNSTGGSLLSILGNIFISFGYVSLFIYLFYNNKLNKTNRLLLLLSSFTTIFGHAALNGGRSNILIAIIWILIFLTIRRQHGIKIKMSNKKNKIIFLCFLLISIAYIFYVINSSSKMGNINMETLVYRSVNSFYGMLKPGVAIPKNKLICYIIYSFIYLYHGQWTTQVALSLNVRPGNYTFAAFNFLLKKLGIINYIVPGYFSDVGAFISLPGAFYYDFGYLGVIVLSTLLGICSYLATLYVKKRNLTGFKLALSIYIIAILIMSPIVPSYGLVYMNYILFSFFIVDIINKIVIKKPLVFSLEEYNESRNCL